MENNPEILQNVCALCTYKGKAELQKMIAYQQTKDTGGRVPSEPGSSSSRFESVAVPDGGRSCPGLPCTDGAASSAGLTGRSAGSLRTSAPSTG